MYGGYTCFCHSGYRILTKGFDTECVGKSTITHSTKHYTKLQIKMNAMFTVNLVSISAQIQRALMNVHVQPDTSYRVMENAETLTSVDQLLTAAKA